MEVAKLTVGKTLYKNPTAVAVSETLKEVTHYNNQQELLKFMNDMQELKKQKVRAIFAKINNSKVEPKEPKNVFFSKLEDRRDYLKFKKNKTDSMKLEEKNINYSASKNFSKHLPLELNEGLTVKTVGLRDFKAHKNFNA